MLDNANVTLPEINTLERDVPDLTAGSVVYELYLSGVLNSVDEYGTFDGQHTVTRGQAAAMLARLVDPAQPAEAVLPTLQPVPGYSGR